MSFNFVLGIGGLIFVDLVVEKIDLENVFVYNENLIFSKTRVFCFIYSNELYQISTYVIHLSVLVDFYFRST